MIHYFNGLIKIIKINRAYSLHYINDAINELHQLQRVFFQQKSDFKFYRFTAYQQV